MRGGIERSSWNWRGADVDGSSSCAFQGQGEVGGNGQREGGVNGGPSEGSYDATGAALQQLNGIGVGGATPRGGGRPPSRDHFVSGVRSGVL